MTTIQMQKHNKDLLREYHEGSFDNILNKLIDDVEENMCLFELMETPQSTIRLKEDTVNRLNQFKLTYSESYENVILRLLLQSKTLNIDVE